MKLARILFALTLTTTATVSFARTMPHAELVAKYLKDGQYKQVLSSCETRPMFAPAAGTPHQLECWAANAANDLQNEPETIAKLVLNGAALDAALSRCKALSIKQRFKSAECSAAGRADSFISLRLPRTVDTLKPLTFK